MLYATTRAIAALLIWFASFHVGCSRRINVKPVLQQQQGVQANNRGGSGNWSTVRDQAQASLLNAAEEEVEAGGDQATPKDASLPMPAITPAVENFVLGIAKAIAVAEDQRPTWYDNMITFADSGDVGVAAPTTDDGCFNAPGNPRLGCNLGCACPFWEACYPKELVWTVGEDQRQTFNIGTCQLTLVVYGVAAAILFVAGAFGCACMRAVILGLAPDEDDMPAMMMTRPPIHVEEWAIKPAFLSEDPLKPPFPMSEVFASEGNLAVGPEAGGATLSEVAKIMAKPPPKIQASTLGRL